MRFAGRVLSSRVVRTALLAMLAAASAADAQAQQLVTDAPAAKPGGTAYVGKYTADYVVSDGPAFHFTAPVTITSIGYDPGPGGARELAVRTLSGCPCNQVIAAGTICAIQTEIASQYPGMRYGTLRITTTGGVFTEPVAFLSVGAQVAVTPGRLSIPQGVAGLAGNALAVDALGNIYLSNSDAAIRKIDAATGAVTIVAGVEGISNRDGDGGPANAAHIGYPVDVAASPAGDVYLVSTAPLANDAVRKVDGGTGIISTVAGFGTGRVPAPGNSGENGTDGAVVVDDQGSIYASVTHNNALMVTAGNGGAPVYLIGSAQDGSKGCNVGAGGSALFAPTTLAVSGGYVYFFSSAAIYKVSTDTSACHAPVLVAGTGVSGNSGDSGLAIKAAFGFVSGIAADAAGDVYLADATNQTVRVVSATTGIISTVAGAGSRLPGVTVGASWSSLAIDVRGNLYVLSAAGTVQKIDVTQGALSFADTAIGQMSSDSPKGVVFTNVGNDTLPAAASTPAVPAGDFILDDATTTCGRGASTTLEAGGSCVADANFAPAEMEALLQGSLSLGGANVVLSGSSSAPPDSLAVDISPGSIDFGNVAQGQTSGTWTVRIGNPGGSPLNLSSMVLSDTGNFVLGGNCGTSVAAYSFCKLTVMFKPQMAGSIHAAIMLTDNAVPATQTITLTGYATQAAYSVTVNPNELTMTQGQTGTASFVFAPTGGFTGAVSFGCAGLPAEATCSFAPATLTADGSDKQQKSMLTVTTRGASNPVAQNMVSGRGFALASLVGCNGMLLMWLKLRRKGALSFKLMGLLLLLSMGMAGATGCGSGGSPVSPARFTPLGSTMVRVVATNMADASTQTATFMLTVK